MLVPLGKRTVTGTVVETNVPPVERMRDLYEVLDESPTFSPAMLRLTRLVSEYYLCSWGEVLQAALPSGLSPTQVARVSLHKMPTEAQLATLSRSAPRRAALLRELVGRPGEITVSYLQKKLGGSPIADQLDALVRSGWITMEVHVEEGATPRMVRCVVPHPELLADAEFLRSTFDSLDTKAPKQSLALGQIYLAYTRDKKPLPVTVLCESLQISVSAIDSLERKGLVVSSIEIREQQPHGRDTLVQTDESSAQLTSDQQRAVTTVSHACKGDAFSVFVLHGVTGSGKTIVYQRVIANMLEQGKRALVLVPEIGLTPQLSDRFRAVFGSRIAVLHSKLAPGERIGLWMRIAAGEVDVVVGARSAVWAPIPDLGMIIVDEEHDASYKQEHPSPRYNGRDVALLRAKEIGCTVVLGSATPSLEALQLVRSGKAQILSIPQRADGAELPEACLVDVREERKARRMMGAFSITALNAMANHVEKGNGVLVFLNRRGYAVHLQCEDCGNVPMCKNCDVALTYHKHHNVLRCHYCGYSEQVVGACTVCGGVDVRESGTGTQKIEEELQKALAERCSRPPVVERMDADTTSRKNSSRSILRRFSNGQIDVLVGTQMIAKGLDIARVSLVVVTNADMSLHQSDFRASERTVQLLTQIAGRAGRKGGEHGTMIVQTSSPEHPAILAALQGERNPMALRQWEEEELRSRQEAAYPPFVRFIVCEISSLYEDAAEHHAKIIEALIPEKTDFLTRSAPLVPPIARIRNHFRRVIVIKNNKNSDPSGKLCRSLLRNALAQYHSTYGTSAVRVTIDVDANGTL